MTEESFAARILKTKKSSLYLVHGTDQGKKAWYYVSVDPMKIPLFVKHPKGERIPLDEYGTVIESGWGEEPPEHIRKKYE